jgi:predicted ferric reductase
LFARYNADYDLWGWASGSVAFALGCVAFLAGVVYWSASHTTLFAWFMFPRFIWLHRLGYLVTKEPGCVCFVFVFLGLLFFQMIFIVFPIHIYQSVAANPFGYVLCYAVCLFFVVELLWRVGHLARSSQCRMRLISEDLFWLEVSVPSSRDQQLYRSGQWVYLTVPRIGIFERHPFTIASVAKVSCWFLLVCGVFHFACKQKGPQEQDGRGRYYARKHPSQQQQQPHQQQQQQQ